MPSEGEQPVPEIPSVLAAAFLDGVIVASLALMTEVGWQLGRASIVDLATAAIACSPPSLCCVSASAPLGSS